MWSEDTQIPDLGPRIRSKNRLNKRDCIIFQIYKIVKIYIFRLLYAEAICVCLFWTNRNRLVVNIYHSIHLIIQSELWILQSALSVNGNIYFYWNYGGIDNQNLRTLCLTDAGFYFLFDYKFNFMSQTN